MTVGGSFSGVKWRGRETDHSYSSSVEVKMKELYLCSTHIPSWRGKGKLYLFYLLHILTAIKNARHPAGRILTQYSMSKQLYILGYDNIFQIRDGVDK